MALDRMSHGGEGYLIANESTLQRLILGDGGSPQGPPHKALTPHIWAHLVIEGNICDAKAESRKQKAENNFQISAVPISDFRTGVIYFARSHQDGIKFERTIPFSLQPSALSLAKTACQEILDNRLTCRKGPEPKEYSFTTDCETLWDAAAEEYRRLYASNHRGK